MALDYRIISADDHMDLHTLPADLWVKRLPAKWRDRAPRVTPTAQGNAWVVDGVRLGASGKGPETEGLMVGPEDDGFRPSNASLRLQDMERFQTQAQVIYGPLRFPMPDAELKAAMLCAFNDWAAEFNAIARERLSILAYLPPHDPIAAATELRRAAKNGFRGVLLHFFEWSEKGMSNALVQSWAPVWEAAAEPGLPLSFHLGGGTHTLKRGNGSWVHMGYAALAGMQLDEVLATMVLSGALERHPGLKVVLGEGGIGWVRFVTERLDRVLYSHGYLAKDVKIKKLPSVVVEEQVYATFEDDPVGLDLLPFGEDNFMWATDYPHPAGDFRRLPEAIARMEKRCAPGQLRKLVRDNCARLYGFRAD